MYIKSLAPHTVYFSFSCWAAHAAYLMLLCLSFLLELAAKLEDAYKDNTTKPLNGWKINIVTLIHSYFVLKLNSLWRKGCLILQLIIISNFLEVKQATLSITLPVINLTRKQPYRDLTLLGLSLIAWAK